MLPRVPPLGKALIVGLFPGEVFVKIL